MWEQYRKTWKGIQLVITLVALSVYLLLGHQWKVALIFFAIMEWSAIVGALWAARLKAFLHRRATELPLRPAS